MFEASFTLYRYLENLIFKKMTYFISMTMTHLGYANVNKLLHCNNYALSLMYSNNFTGYIEEMTL